MSPSSSPEDKDRKTMTFEEREQCIEGLVANILEFGDAVQVLVSWVDEQENTRCLKYGSGNWYTRKAMVSEFLDEARALAEEYVLGQLPPPEGGSLP